MNRHFYSGLVLIFGLVILVPSSTGSIQCKDETGNNVDWSIVYKIPKESKNYQSNGLETVYMTSKGETTWIKSKHDLDDDQSLIGLTLEPLYSKTKKASVNYILYSDQPPDKETSGAAGHSKGVLTFDSSTGFWLIHSVPKFPVDPTKSRYEYPNTGEINGQTFVCVSFKTQRLLTDIVEQLLYIRPGIYGQSIDDAILSKNPLLSDLIKKKWTKQDQNEKELISLGGKSLISFVKSPKARIDIYSQLAAQSLKTDLLAETWRKGIGGPLPSECDLTYQVVNIDQMSINYSSKSAVWSYTEDHSKWAISGKSDEPFVCVGDINRMASQAKRGGGLICFKNPNVWKTLHSSVLQFEPCPKPKKRSNPSLISRAKNFFIHLFKR